MKSSNRQVETPGLKCSKETIHVTKSYRKAKVVTCSDMEQEKGGRMTECAAVERTEEATTMQQSKEEDYSEGCYRENYMIPHVCPIPTGGWCRDYVKCKNMSVQRGQNE